MEAPRPFTEKELQSKGYEEIKNLLKARGLSTQGYKQKLILRLLEYQKTGKGKKARKTESRPIPKTSVLDQREKTLPQKISKYLNGNGKYQKDCNYLVYLSSKDEIPNEEGSFFRIANQLYIDYFRRNIPFDEEYMEIKIENDVIDPIYERFLSEHQNISTPEEYENFMDEVVGIVYQNTRQYFDKVDRTIGKLYSYENPRYFDIPLSENLLYYLIAELGNISSPSEIEDFLIRNRVGWFQFRAGDIVGFRAEKSNPDSLPEILVYFDQKNGPRKLTFDVKINYKGDIKRYSETNRVDYPGELKYASPEVLQRLYNFPFYRL